MNYLISYDEQVLRSERKTTYIKAKNKEEAEKLAKQKFANVYGIDNEYIINIKAENGTKEQFISLIFMFCSILLSFITWYKEHDAVNFSPDLWSTMISVFFFVVYLIRFKGIEECKNAIISNKLNIFLYIMVVVTFSSLIKIFLSVEHLKIFDYEIVAIDTKALLVVAGLLSLVGLKIISIICVGLIMICSMINVGFLNDAMGVWGAIYIICVSFGLLMFCFVEPSLVRFVGNVRNRVASLGMKEIEDAKKSFTDIKETVEKNVISKK